MPPRIPARQVRQVYECPSCTARRSFAVSATRSRIGPESPRYIDVPEAPQQSVPDRPRVKGILPVPRDIFTGKARGRGLDKADDNVIDRATKLPQPRDIKAKASPHEDRLAWKERMADMRRKNLREGLQALRERRVKSDARVSDRSTRRQQEREAMLHRPQREDERLTQASIDVTLQKVLRGGVGDPDRAMRLERKNRNVQEKEAARKEERLDALHSLFMNARDFIVTEEQLDKAIADEFPPGGKAYNGISQATSIWENGAPPTVQEMLNAASGLGGGSSGALSSAGGYETITSERIKRMAEKLTGGKMDN